MIDSSAAGPRGWSPGAPLIALTGAAAVALAFQFCILLLVGALPAAGYLAFGVLVNAVAVLLLGAAFARVPSSVPIALAAWAALQAAFFFLEPRHVPLALAFGTTTGVLLAISRTARESPIASGIVVGGALCLTLIVFPKALLMAWPSLPPGVPRDVLRVATFGALVATVPIVDALRRRWPRAPSAIVWMLVALGGAAAATPGTWERRPWITSGARSEPARVDDDRPSSDRPSILLLVLDTVRADHLSVYGYERDTTPELARFLEGQDRAVVYPLAFSPAPWTVPSHASLLTGLMPSSHGAHDGNIMDGKRSKSIPGVQATRTLAEVLRSNGYSTGAIFANVHLRTTPGMERGFEVFFQPHTPRSLFLLGETLRARLLPWFLPEAATPYPEAARIREGVLRFVDESEPGPWFVLANFMEAHQPYAPRAPYAGRFGGNRSWNPPVLVRVDDATPRQLQARDRYDEEIASLDAELGLLLSELERRGVTEHTWIVITSDHGEAFGERGTATHGSSVYNEQVRVPLIVVPPAGSSLPPRGAAVSLLDVAATLSAIGSGESLGSGTDLRRPRSDDDEPARIEFFGNPAQTGADVVRHWGPLFNTPARAVVWNEAKLIAYSDRAELYDLGSDLGEFHDLLAKQTSTAKVLTSLLPPLTSPVAPTRHTLTPDELDALRALGYLGD